MSLRTALHTLRRSATSAIRTTQNPIPVRAFAVVELGDSTAFENKVSNSSGVVVVDWSASWCGPCKMAAPVYEQLSEKYSQYPFYKIDVDTLGEEAMQNNVQSVPTFTVIKDGTEVQRIIGADMASLEQGLQQLA
eukprot:TRINITY_DN663_c0_g1_i2.p2 TRINITY_DN663_c0_g1~~TRINITY_DN663_c0_g1_i2.p2  ORF type:complete len:135 (+),score=33.38 TRINITY_DN663_c0_g1_i2:101-505(+)